MTGTMPACFHDCEYDATEVPEPDGSRTTTAVCRECSTTLWEKTHRPDGTVTRLVHDHVYELLYTRKGRLVLAREALKVRGWPEPSAWDVASP